MDGRFTHTINHRTINCNICGRLCCLEADDCFANYSNGRKGTCDWCLEKIEARKLLVNPFKKKSLIFNETLEEALKRYGKSFGFCKSFYYWFLYAYIKPYYK